MTKVNPDIIIFIIILLFIIYKNESSNKASEIKDPYKVYLINYIRNFF